METINLQAEVIRRISDNFDNELLMQGILDYIDQAQSEEGQSRYGDTSKELKLRVLESLNDIRAGRTYSAEQMDDFFQNFRYDS